MGDQVFDSGRNPGALRAARFDPAPGSALRGSLEFASSPGADASAALETVEAADQLLAWASAMRYRALARLAETIGHDAGPRAECQPERFDGGEARAMAVAEVSAATAITETTAARLVDEATELCGPHWRTREALEAGQISEAHARVILDAARSVPDEDAPHFARAALERSRTRAGRRRTPSELRSFLRRMRERTHPESIETRKRAALRERGVWFAPDPDGMCTLTARLAAESGLAIFTGLDHAARSAQGPDEPRCLDELRADALAQFLLGHDGQVGPAQNPGAPGPGDDPAHSPGAPGPAFRPQIVVTIPVHTLLAIDPAASTADSPGPDDGGAELEGYGPIDAPTARYLASLAPNWERLFTDAVTGEALGVGRTAYRPTQALRRFLAYRDGACLFPACTCPAMGCEPDHTIEWQHGGTTDPENLALLCPRHHALKSIGAWTYTRTTDSASTVGSLLEWRSPLGRTYRTEAADRATDEFRAYQASAPRPPNAPPGAPLPLSPDQPRGAPLPESPDQPRGAPPGPPTQAPDAEGPVQPASEDQPPF